jgi:hypothetical protein
MTAETVTRAEQPLGPFTEQSRSGLILHGLLVLCAAGSTAAHGWTAVTGGHGPGWSLIMTAMMVLCAPCVFGLVRRPQAITPVRMVLGMAVAMVLLHVMAITLFGGTAGMHPSHAKPSPTLTVTTGSASEVRHITMTIPLIALELVVTALASLRLRAGQPANLSAESEPEIVVR